VVTSAQPLLVVVPLDNHLDIEARVSNRDIGFVEAGQEAEIKVATFYFTRYGLLHGRVLMVSRDAIGRDDLRDETLGRQCRLHRGSLLPHNRQAWAVSSTSSIYG
jgi:hemolysin D